MSTELETALMNLVISVLQTSQEPTSVVERSQVKAVATAVNNLIEQRIKDEVYKIVTAGRI